MSMSIEKPALLVHCRLGPYHSSLARSGIEFAMAAAVFDQETALLFSGDGVWQLLKDQDPTQINAKNHAKLLSALPLYDVTQIYVDEQALASRSLAAEDLALDVAIINTQQIQALLAASRQVFNF